MHKSAGWCRAPPEISKCQTVILGLQVGNRALGGLTCIASEEKTLLPVFPPTVYNCARGGRTFIHEVWGSRPHGLKNKLNEACNEEPQSVYLPRRNSRLQVMSVEEQDSRNGTVWSLLRSPRTCWDNFRKRGVFARMGPAVYGCIFNVYIYFALKTRRAAEWSSIASKNSRVNSNVVTCLY